MKPHIKLTIVLIFLSVVQAFAGGPIPPNQIIGASGYAAEVNKLGQLHTVMRGMVDASNTSIVPLASGAVFTGSAADTLDYAEICVSVFTDVDSAVDGLCLEFSSDGLTWYDGGCMGIAASKAKTFSFQPERKYYRLKYTNGGLPQGTFNLSSILRKTRAKPSSHNINKPIVVDDDAELVKAVITGQRADGVFSNATLSNSDRLRVVNQPYGYAVSEGDIVNHKRGLSVGERTSLTTNPSDVWLGAAETIPIPPDAGDLISVVSTSVQDTLTTGTGAWTVFIGYLTPAGLQASTTINMTGTTPVDTGILMRYVNTMSVQTANGLAAAAGNITAYKTGTAATVYRNIVAGTNAELGCHRMVPANKNMYITAWKASVAGAGKPVAIRIRATINVDTGVITPRLFHHLDSVYLESAALKMEFGFPIKLPPLTIIKATAKASQAGPYVSASLEGWLEDI